MIADNSMQVRPGFSDPILDAQHTFRVCLDAMAHPAQIYSLPDRLEAPAPLSNTAAAIALTLADFEVSLWLDETLAAVQDVADFLRFHTGAQIAERPDEADFAIAAAPAKVPALSAFKQGTPEYPDRSTTLILQVDSLSNDSGDAEMMFRGPGIRETARIAASPLPTSFAAQLHDNRALFPCGVDVILASDSKFAALPRSAVIQLES